MTALDALRCAQAALELALDGHDARAIDIACERFRAAMLNARTSGDWRAKPQLARAAFELLGRVEIARQSVKVLTHSPGWKLPSASQPSAATRHLQSVAAAR